LKRLCPWNIFYERQETFIYVGSKITWDNDCSEDIRTRVQLIAVIYASFKTIWNVKKESRPRCNYWRRVCFLFCYTPQKHGKRTENERRPLAYEMGATELVRLCWQEKTSNETVRQRLDKKETILWTLYDTGSYCFSDIFVVYARRSNAKESIARLSRRVAGCTAERKTSEEVVGRHH